MRAVLFRTLLCVAFSAISVFAQTGSITGQVTDPSGAVIPGAKVTATNVATNASTSTVTGANGYYNIVQVQPGPYKVLAETDGFTPVTQTGIDITVGLVARINFKLELGTVATTVEVASEAPLLESETSTIGQLVDNRRVEELPLRGRNPYALASIVPGARVPVTWGDLPVDMFTDAHAVINGARGNQNEFLLNGTPNTNGVQGGANIFPSVDAVQEFKVETNNYSAEYGRAAGGVFNVVTKSGTNRIHGTLFEFHRNENLNANDFFQNRAGKDKPPFTFNQFGGTIGGPIINDRLFYFVNYEGAREREGITFTHHVPTAAERAGDFSQTFNSAGNQIVIYDPLSTQGTGATAVRDPFPNNQVPVDRFDPVSSSLQELLPMPNAPGAQFTSQDNFIAGAPNKINKHVWSVKNDYIISDNHRISGMFSYDRSPSIRPNAFGNNATPTLGPQMFQRRGVTFEDTLTMTPTTVLSFRYGLSRLTNERTPFSYQTDITQYGWPQQLQNESRVPCVPTVTATGFVAQFSRSNLGGNRLMGACDVIFFGLDTHTWSGNVSKVKGDHTFKFGYEYRLMRNNSWQVNERNFGFNNAFTQGPIATTPSSSAGYSYASYLLGYAASGTNNISPAIAAQYQYHATFMQDSWKVSPKLTLNLGVRWEHSVPRTDRFDQLANFDYDGDVPLDAPGYNLKGTLAYPGTGGLSRSQQMADYNDFSPRFGFAYQVAQSTVLRGGFGISYAPSQVGTGAGGLSGYSSQTSLVTSLNGVTPVRQWSDPFPIVIQPTGSSLGGATLLGQNVAFVNRNERTPYTEQWNFNLQHQLPGQVLIDAAYVGSHGVKLQASRQLNQLNPQFLAMGDQLRELVDNPFYGQIEAGALSNPKVTRAQLLRPYPHFGNVTATQSNWGNSNYHALQLTVEKRYSDGITLMAAYAYSKLIDDVGGAFAGEATAATGVQDWYNLRNERSVSPFDQTQSLVLSYIWDLPFGPGRGHGPQSGFASKLIQGWQMQGITSFQNGPPIGITQGNNTTFSQGGGQRPNRSSADPRIDDPTVDRWFNTDPFTSPAPYTFGDGPRTIGNLRGDGTAQFDIAFAKKSPINDRLALEFRTEFFNIMNTPRFQRPINNSSSNAFARTSVQINKPRTIQVGLKLLF